MSEIWQVVTFLNHLDDLPALGAVSPPKVTIGETIRRIAHLMQ
jgi:hypothetical protein